MDTRGETIQIHMYANTRAADVTDEKMNKDMQLPISGTKFWKNGDVGRCRYHRLKRIPCDILFAVTLGILRDLVIEMLRG